MYDFHLDRKKYFDIQYENSNKYIIPFIEKVFDIKKEMNVLEVGCGEGGVLKSFLDLGTKGVGVDLDLERIKIADDFLKSYSEKKQVEIIGKNIYDSDFENNFEKQFDIIILKDVIEHIHDQKKILLQLKKYLNKNGVIFFGFPPWYMPFGGHQQIAKNKLLSRLPYFHILPMPIYKGILKLFKEKVEPELVEIKQTGISINRFEELVKQANYKILNKTEFLFNPIYEYKFNIKTKKQNKIISQIPILKEFLTTCCYYLIT